jgi:hypothetical protein
LTGTHARASYVRDQARDLQDFVQRTSGGLASAALFTDASMRVSGDDSMAAEKGALLKQLAARRKSLPEG